MSLGHPDNDGWEHGRKWAGKVGFKDGDAVRLSRQRVSATPVVDVTQQTNRSYWKHTRTSSNHQAQRTNGSDSKRYIK